MNLCQLNQRALLAVPVAGQNPAAPRTPAQPTTAEALERIVRGLGPDPARMNRRDLLRMTAFVAAYAVEQAARRIHEES